MKKYITAAALLAAGTALASAATVLTEEIKSWDSFSASDFTALTTSSGGSATVNSSGQLVIDTLGRAQFDLGTTTLDFTNNVYQIELTVSNWTAGNGPSIVFGLSGATADAAKQKLGFGYNDTDHVWAGTLAGGSMTLKGNSDSSTTGGHSNLSGVLTVTIGSGHMKATFLKDNDSNAVTLIDQPDTADTATTKGKIEGTIQYVTLGGWVSGATAATSTKPSNGSSMTVSSMTISQVIPEPSAFGLFAGAGALALVAARRRRKS